MSVSIRQHSTAYVAGSKGSKRGSSMRTQTCMSEGAKEARDASAYVKIRQHTSAFEKHAHANMHVRGGACGAPASPATSMRTGAPCGMRQAERERGQQHFAAQRCATKKKRTPAKRRGRVCMRRSALWCAASREPERASERERWQQHDLAKDQKITQLPH